jgi:hypothetical protein
LTSSAAPDCHSQSKSRLAASTPRSARRLRPIQASTQAAFESNVDGEDSPDVDIAYVWFERAEEQAGHGHGRKKGPELSSSRRISSCRSRELSPATRSRPCCRRGTSRYALRQSLILSDVLPAPAQRPGRFGSASVSQSRRAACGGHCSGTPALPRPSKMASSCARYVGSPLIAVPERAAAG